MSSIVKVSDNRVNDDVVNTFSMMLGGHHVRDSLKDVKSYSNSIEKEKNKKYD